MSWESAEDRRRRFHDHLVVVCVLAIVAWPTLAFGGVYRWAYVPLLIACASVGWICVARHDEMPRVTSQVPLWLAAVGAGALLQTVPLPASVLAAVSPATHAFLKSYLFSYAAGVASPETASTVWHPLSLAPESTGLAIAFLVALTVLLAGVMRWFRPSHVPTIVRGLMALGVLVAVVGIMQKALGSQEVRQVRIYGFWRPQFFGNAFGPFVNRNHFAGWMLMVLPLGVAYFAATLAAALATVPRGLRNRLLWLGSEGAGQSITVGFSVLVMVVALVYSSSRSGLACAVFVVAAFGWLTVRSSIGRRTRIAVVSVFVLIAAAAMVWAGSDIVFTRFTLIPAEIGGRIGTWRDAVRVVRDFPLFGVGLNAYHVASLKYQTVVSEWQYDVVHNDYLQVAAEGGIMLTLPAVLALVALVRELRGRARQQAVRRDRPPIVPSERKRADRYPPGDEDRHDALVSWLRVGALVGLAAIALQSFVDFSLQIPANAVLLVVLIGIAAHRPAEQPSDRPSARAVTVPRAEHATAAAVTAPPRSTHVLDSPSRLVH